MRVLFVDDEAHLLAGLRRLTRANRTWSTLFAGGAPEALDVVRGTSVDVVVTDMRMPGMDGLELMEALAAEFPDVVRVVLTGHVDEERGHRAESLAHAWLNKPCSLDALTAAVDDALRFAVPAEARP